MSKSKKKKNRNPEEIQAEEVSIITLTDEDGNKYRYEYLETIEYKGKTYCVLYPDVDSDGEDYMICEVTGAPGTDIATYSGVDERTMNKVFEIFKNS